MTDYNQEVDLISVCGKYVIIACRVTTQTDNGQAMMILSQHVSLNLNQRNSHSCLDLPTTAITPIKGSKNVKFFGLVLILPCHETFSYLSSLNTFKIHTAWYQIKRTVKV